jgi:uncharacterized tellurite resistance protein B-like protein
MDKIQTNVLLLKTAFACMACDGDIDPREINLVHKLSQEEGLFQDEELQVELNALVDEFNIDSSAFISCYFTDLKTADLSKAEQILVIKNAINTIQADEKVEYREIKFFKSIRAMLPISDEEILAVFPDIEDYLEQDIINVSYEDRLKALFFDKQTSPHFNNINLVDIKIPKHSTD